jgi:hypothetical protein
MWFRLLYLATFGGSPTYKSLFWLRGANSADLMRAKTRHEPKYLGPLSLAGPSGSLAIAQKDARAWTAYDRGLVPGCNLIPAPLLGCIEPLEFDLEHRPPAWFMTINGDGGRAISRSGSAASATYNSVMPLAV